MWSEQFSGLCSLQFTRRPPCSSPLGLPRKTPEWAASVYFPPSRRLEGQGQGPAGGGLVRGLPPGLGCPPAREETLPCLFEELIPPRGAALVTAHTVTGLAISHRPPAQTPSPGLRISVWNPGRGGGRGKDTFSPVHPPFSDSFHLSQNQQCAPRASSSDRQRLTPARPGYVPGSQCHTHQPGSRVLVVNTLTGWTAPGHTDLHGDSTVHWLTPQGRASGPLRLHHC